MDKTRIEQYTILYQYLLKLKEPLYILLIQILQRKSPTTWWDEYIQPYLKDDEKTNFKYLDSADLLYIYKINYYFLNNRWY
jgi:hypothetical protein